LGETVISTRELTKHYGHTVGVEGLDLEVYRGELFGFLGPNGAGKTTTMRLLMGMLKPTGGSASVLGHDSWKESVSVNELVGYLPGDARLYDGLTGNETIAFISRFNNVRAETGIALADRFELDLSRKVAGYSRGMKQKLAIIAAFMHDPAIYVMDEPTIGLDPLMRNTFIELILEEKRRGKTIFMSSHSFDEIERTCDRAGIIREGKLVAVEDINSLKAARRKVISVTVASDEDIGKLTESDLEIENISGKHIDVIVRDNFDSFIAALNECKVQGLDIKAQGLEQVFLKYYGQKKVKE